MNDEGIIRRAPLRLEYSADGAGVEGVRPEAVDRFSRKDHEAPGPQGLGRSGYLFESDRRAGATPVSI